MGEDNGCYSSSLLTSTEPNSTDDASDGNGSGKATRDLNSDKGTCGSSGGAPSPDSPESFLETKIDEQDNIENIKIAAVPVIEEVKADSAAIQMDVETRSEVSVDSSCTREHREKRWQLKYPNLK